MKHLYNQDYILIKFNIRDTVFIYLHQDYYLPILYNTHRKLSQQYTRLFKILKYIRYLVYQLELPEKFNIYLVFSVAQLEPTTYIKYNTKENPTSNNTKLTVNPFNY